MCNVPRYQGQAVRHLYMTHALALPLERGVKLLTRTLPFNRAKISNAEEVQVKKVCGVPARIKRFS